MRGTSTLTVEIPAGVDTGTRLRLSGKGGAGQRGAARGDVFVDISVRSDARFERVGDDLHHRVAVGFTEATFGIDVDIPMLDGEMENLEIPAGTQPESVFRLAKKGVPRLQRRGRGDLLVHIEVAVPTNLDADAETALRDYAQVQGEKPSAKKRGLFRR
jgi:molecular chaperone DnaJ